MSFRHPNGAARLGAFNSPIQATFRAVANAITATGKILSQRRPRVTASGKATPQKTVQAYRACVPCQRSSYDAWCVLSE